MRITNSQARKMVNRKLLDAGKSEISDDLSYEEYAMKLRMIIGLRSPLNTRSEATGYIRWAAQHLTLGVEIA